MITLGIGTFLFTKSQLLAGVIFVGSWIVAARLTRPLIRIPANDLTIEDLVWWSFDPAQQKLTRDCVFEKVAAIIVDQLGVTREQVVEDAHFIEDLGMA